MCTDSKLTNTAQALLELERAQVILATALRSRSDVRANRRTGANGRLMVDVTFDPMEVIPVQLISIPSEIA
jgi:hypothetical protein